MKVIESKYFPDSIEQNGANKPDTQDPLFFFLFVFVPSTKRCRLFAFLLLSFFFVSFLLCQAISMQLFVCTFFMRNQQFPPLFLINLFQSHTNIHILNRNVYRFVSNRYNHRAMPMWHQAAYTNNATHNGKNAGVRTMKINCEIEDYRNRKRQTNKKRKKIYCNYDIANGFIYVKTSCISGAWYFFFIQRSLIRFFSKRFKCVIFLFGHFGSV